MPDRFLTWFRFSSITRTVFSGLLSLWSAAIWEREEVGAELLDEPGLVADVTGSELCVDPIC
jgi:hypothetical protein